MKLWPFKRKAPEPKAEPDDEVWTITVTPYAGMVFEMLSWGWSKEAIVWVLQKVEAERSATDARVRAEMSAVTSTRRQMDKRADNADTALDRRREKWRRQKQNQRTRLKLVHPSTKV